MSNLLITPEMEDYFLDFETRHRNSVAGFARLFFINGVIGPRLFKRISELHDLDKFKAPIYLPYVRRKWVEHIAGKDMYQDMDEETTRAIAIHVTKNPHHPEFWAWDYAGFSTQAPIHIDFMSRPAIVEMICDWSAMGIEYENTARAWYNSVNGTRWIFSKKVQRDIEHFLGVMEQLTERSVSG